MMKMINDSNNKLSSELNDLLSSELNDFKVEINNKINNFSGVFATQLDNLKIEIKSEISSAINNIKEELSQLIDEKLLPINNKLIDNDKSILGLENKLPHISNIDVNESDTLFTPKLILEELINMVILPRLLVNLSH